MHTHVMSQPDAGILYSHEKGVRWLLRLSGGAFPENASWGKGKV